MSFNFKWNKRFLRLAKEIASWSKDPSSQVGCVIVGPKKEIRSTGYNGFARGIEDRLERLKDRKQKYPRIIHAEMNAVITASYIGTCLDGCTAFITLPPCTPCASALINAGIVSIIIPEVEIPDRWKEDMAMAVGDLAEAGVHVAIQKEKSIYRVAGTWG